MGLMDKVKELTGKLTGNKKLVAEHGDKVVSGVDKATDVIDDKTGGKYSDHLQTVDDATVKAVDKLDGDATPPPTP